MTEFIIFIATVCQNNVIYAHVNQYDWKDTNLKNPISYYVPIVKNCKSAQVLGVISDVDVELRKLRNYLGYK